MLDIHNVIDTTLEKIRAKIIDKALEAENMFKEFDSKLFEGRCCFETVKRQLNQLEDHEVEQLQVTKPSLYESMVTQFERKEELELI